MSKIDWPTKYAIEMEQRGNAIAFLRSRGWQITSGTFTCDCGPACIRPECATRFYTFAFELRDPTGNRYVKSWRTAVRRQLERERLPLERRAAFRVVSGGVRA